MKRKPSEIASVIEREIAAFHTDRLVVVEVISAVPLTEGQLADLETRLVKGTRRQVQLVPRVDESLVGGLRLVSDGRVMDASIKSRLEEMKEKLHRGVQLTK